MAQSSCKHSVPKMLKNSRRIRSVFNKCTHSCVRIEVFPRVAHIIILIIFPSSSFESSAGHDDVVKFSNIMGKNNRFSKTRERKKMCITYIPSFRVSALIFFLAIPRHAFYVIRILSITAILLVRK